MNKFKNHQLYRLVEAHFTEIVRQPEVIFWGIVFPILMAWGLGIAFTQKGGVQAKLALVKVYSTTDSTQETKLSGYLSRNAVKKGNSYSIKLDNKKLGSATLTFFETSWSNAYTMLKKGKVSVIIEDNLTGTRYHFDPANAEAKIAYQLASGLANYGSGFYAANQSDIQPLALAGTRYVDFLIPGLLGMGIMMACSWGHQLYHY